MTTRKYTSRSQQTTLTSAVTSGALILPVASATTLLGGATVSSGQTFTVVIDPDTSLEEIVDVTVVNGNNLTVTRAVDMSGAAAQDHSAGAVVRHMVIGRDLREANLHAEATGAYNDGTSVHLMHGLGSSDGVVVGTDATQTLANKTLTAPIINNPTITGSYLGDAGIVFEGSTADAYETTLQVIDPTADRTISLPNATGTVVLADNAQTLTNKTIDMTGVTLTGLSSAGMVSSSATPKNYVDSILGSATAASTSAASAATSASSAAISASSAATSASSALTSQAAAATSATSAAASATAAATSVTSAAASATAAATSATSAAASATTAANSVATIASYATTASNSAAAAATSATSAAASATAAATSATSAAASATAAATSATSAAASATAAAGSATAAATSATSAAASATAAASSAAQAAAAVGAAFLAKGDLLAGTAAGAYTSLSVASTSGYILSADSTTATGLKWIARDTGDITAVSVSSPLTGGGTAGDVSIAIQDASTTQKGAVQLTDSTASTSVTTAATPNSVKTAYDLANAAVAKSVVTTKGDLIAATGSAAVTRLGVGTNGQYLMADSTTTSGLTWSTVDALPSQTGNSGKYLTTNGTSASWASIVTDPTPSIFMLMGA